MNEILNQLFDRAHTSYTTSEFEKAWPSFTETCIMGTAIHVNLNMTKQKEFHKAPLPVNLVRTIYNFSHLDYLTW